ncbi:MAG: TrmB family transcriptional regulator [Planctomycetes bacterium]|nr:TrmB family transcriptional regulator [Planctomycetota bacterium]
MRRPDPALTEAFAELGFTGAETVVYCALLQQPDCTGYALARQVDLPVANTYKAVASLQRKGAVVVDDGRSRRCRAVPVDELLTSRRRDFERHAATARSALAALRGRAPDDRVWRLEDADAVLQRARELLRAATRVALADVFPAPLRALRDDLRAAARRGVRVVVKVYEDVDLPRVECVRMRDPSTALTVWPGQQLSVVVDASEHLLALLSADLRTVHQAVWSASDFLSCMHHNHLANEIQRTAANGVLRGRRGRSLATLSVLHGELPGLSTLRQRLADVRTSR